MLREAIKEAATIDNAKQAAATELGMAVEKVQFEILQMPQKKTFGLFGGCPARVRAYYELSPATRAADYLREILNKLGVEDPDIKITMEENGCILKLSGDDLGFIIGRRGETLDALQYLTGLVANRVDNAYYRVTLDIGNYREKREQSLSGLARKIAGQAARTGRKTSLEPMNPYERRIIHTAVQNVKGATSWSMGSDFNRHVVIGPSDDNPVRNRSYRNNGQSSRSKAVKNNDHVDHNSYNHKSSNSQTKTTTKENSIKEESNKQLERPACSSNSDTIERPQRPVRKFVPRSNPLPTADGATPPAKTPSEKENTSVLYGRIDL